MRTPRVKARSKLLALFAALTVIGTLGIAPALAVHDDGKFELDKNTSNNTNIFRLGDLAANITSTATSLNICRTATGGTFDPIPTAPFLIQLEAERMNVSAVAAGSFGGNCLGTKQTYTISRAADGTTATAHAKGGVDGIISLYVPNVSKPGTDWNQVYAELQGDPDSTCASLGLVECTFVSDQIGPTTFIGGASKDHLPVAGWQHTSGSSPDKAEILNAYAAKAIGDADHQILYFGMDRYAVDGSTDIGFWFFKGPVVANPDGTFTGEHQIGDILALGTFTQGGATSNIRVFRWVGTGGNESDTIQGPDGTFGDCVPGQSGDSGCATVNNTTVPVPWTYTFKGSAKSGWVPAGGGFEGGIDLTALGLEGCFSSFLAETRSSPEITAILKDFALGGFEACEGSVTTTPSDGESEALTDTNDNDIPDIQLGTGAAGADVTDAALVDVTGTDEWDGTLTFYLCGPIPTDELCDGTDNVGVEISSDVIDETDPQPIFSEVANLTEVGYYCWRGFFDSATPGVDDTADASVGECFEVLPVTPTLTTTSVDSEGNAFSGPVPFGDNVYDKATLSGTANEPGDNGGNSEFPSINATNGTKADGTITFTLKVDAGDSCGANATGTGTNPEDVDVDGDGDYFTSGFAPGSPGVYAWVASYDGSTSGNTLGDDHNTDCTDAAENYTVQQLTPSVATAQTWRPQDSATITVASGGGALDGTVDFELFDNEDCTGTALYDEFDVAITVDGTGLSATAATNNTDFDVSTSTHVWWKVTYDSNNQGHTDAFSVCVEDTDLTIDNTTAPAP